MIEYRKGQILYGRNGGKIELVSQCPPDYGDQQTHGPVWWCRDLDHPRAAMSTYYVWWFDESEETAKQPGLGSFGKERP